MAKTIESVVGVTGIMVKRCMRCRLFLCCLSVAGVLAIGYCSLVDGPRYARHASPFNTCDIITESITYGDTTYGSLWISRPGDEDMAHWMLIGPRVNRGWVVDWCGPRHVVLTNVGDRRARNPHRVLKFGDIEVLELHFGAQKEIVSPDGKSTLWTWNGWGTYATAILANNEDSIRLLSLSESARVDGRWLDEHRLQIDIHAAEIPEGLPVKWRGIEIEMR